MRPDNFVKPLIDLRDPQAIAEQRRTIARFIPRRRCLWGGGLSILIAFFGIPWILDVFAGGSIEPWATLLVLVSIAFATVAALRYKCPNCGAVPSGSSWALGGEARYSRGINPFPRCCAKCGHYLSSKALEADIRRAESSGAQSSSDLI